MSARHHRRGRRGLLLALLALVLPAAARAQVGSTTDILTGVVTGPDKRPIEGAVVEATSVETQITRHAVTNAKGRYTLLFPDGGGQYRLAVKSVGLAEQRFAVVRQSDEDRLVHDVALSATAQMLGEVRVTARPRGNRDRPTPGSTERDISGEAAAHLPIDASDPMALAALAPGVISIAGTDTTAAAFSVAGQRPTGNSVTLDGLTFGGASVPQDAVRSTRVITNTYDVSRGQFTGGIVATTTKGGTNVPAGSFTYTLRDRSLAWGGESSAFGQGYDQNQLGGGFGGPIVSNKLFIFGSLQGRWRSENAQTLLAADPSTLLRLGTDPDSVARFLSLVRAYGLPVSAVDQSDSRETNTGGALLRLDYLISDKQTLTLRGDWRLNTQDPTRVSPYGLSTGAGQMADHGGGLMVTLTSHFDNGIINELRAYGSVDHRVSDPFLVLPAARVQVASSLGDSVLGVSNLTFGGSPALPQTANTHSLETTDELSWLPGDAKHRIKLGGLLNISRFSQDVTLDRYGIFTFNSLTDLESNAPATFTRTLQPSDRAGTAVNPALYLGDSWRATPALQLTYGMRLEGSLFRGTPAYNPLVDTLFGLRTDHFPSEIHASPRLGFTWTGTNATGGPAPLIIRGGFGEFRSPAPTSLFSSAEGATGLQSAEAQLVCVGADVPTPDWAAYAANAAAIPTTCASGGSGFDSRTRPNVTVFDPSFGAPRAWRASLGVQKRFLDRYGVSLDAGFARGVNLFGFRDLNLDTQPQFTLPDEGNRPVFVPASSIITTTGAVDPFASRLHPQFGQVLAVTSDLASESEQVTLGLNGFTMRGLIVQGSYTYSRARDQSSFSGASATQGYSSATTAGDPNVREWATSDLERRHQFLVTATYPVAPAWEITTIARLISGAPYTPMVGSDINGDGARNDRAFVFNPATTADTAVANGMARVLAGASSGARSCLNTQLGLLSSRNSCTGPWQPSVDVQINFRPAVLGLARRLMISLSTVNLLGGVDQLLHGSQDLHGWGLVSRPDATLLYVKGFDPSTNSYQYTVNERFGATGGSAAAVRVPFQIALQAHFTVGPDQATDRIRGLFGGGGGRGGGRGGGFGPGEGSAANSADLASRFARLVPNPISAILALKDTLALTDSQTTRLTAMRDSLDTLQTAIADSLHTTIDAAGQNADPARLFASIRPQLLAARTNAQRALQAAEHVLTKEQWGKIPADVKTPGRRAGGRGGAPP